ncbi:hypothetical protein PIB30_010303 [Stylosanthes scabra]|uniref:Uncharacterized protein n=1 Tax=Stylosanthes scabra TaxID=79078 RepID=A0ABU6U463_9FABA|nr:hypothetical protein [Stylosanthes scabra]
MSYDGKWITHLFTWMSSICHQNYLLQLLISSQSINPYLKFAASTLIFTIWQDSFLQDCELIESREGKIGYAALNWRIRRYSTCFCCEVFITSKGSRTLPSNTLVLQADQRARIQLQIKL